MLTFNGPQVSVFQDAFVTTHAPTAIRDVSDRLKQIIEERSLEKRGVCNTQALLQPELAGEWGLGRISHAHIFPIPKYGWPNYTYDAENRYCPQPNTGGVAYIIDSGINVTHPEFGGRAIFGYNANPSGWPSDDVCGHGTHVAGIVGGKTYGVQKTAKLIGVKVLEGYGGNCGGSWAQVISGINWSYNHSVIYKITKYSVINMSLGSYHTLPWPWSNR